jgi:nucleotide-binding universal stress UspA family protein
MKILVAIDGSGCSEPVIDEIILRPWPKDTEVKLITAVEYTAPPTSDTWALDSNYLDKIDKVAVLQAEAVMDRAIGRMEYRPNPNVKISREILRGSAKEVILDEAKQWNPDLVMVGSHGHHGLKRLWLGSVSQAIANHAKCSVEIVRCPEATDGSSRVVTPVDEQC